MNIQVNRVTVKRTPKLLNNTFRSMISVSSLACIAVMLVLGAGITTFMLDRVTAATVGYFISLPAILMFYLLVLMLRVGSDESTIRPTTEARNVMVTLVMYVLSTISMIVLLWLLHATVNGAHAESVNTSVHATDASIGHAPATHLTIFETSLISFNLFGIGMFSILTIMPWILFIICAVSHYPGRLHLLLGMLVKGLFMNLPVTLVYIALSGLLFVAWTYLSSINTTLNLIGVLPLLYLVILGNKLSKEIFHYEND